MKRSFGSDNHSGVHPQILEAIEVANTDFVPAYGEDPYTQEAEALFRQEFGVDVNVFFSFNGTGANVLCLKALTQSYNSIICADTAHIHVDECGAPEFFTGCKVIAISTPNGKLTPDLVKRELKDFGFQHHAQPKVISISQATEFGTLYTPAEISALATLAHQYDMYLHVDGSRLANASASTGISFKTYITDTGVDALSFGGTKNGMLLGEAVVLLRPELAQNFLYIRKQAMQLFSKSRFIAAQYIAYLKNGLWKETASHANKMAAYLTSLLKNVPEVVVTHQVECNAVFAVIPRAVCQMLLEKHLFYVWDEEICQVRWMCSFTTTKEDIDLFISDLKSLLNQNNI
ncbi:MAG: low specificity L-threonine aldolase [Prevotellaceae bacterium]|jgi:threonine aldolase|nr:low specificity L-threonine aldolase [Prevotellaceae bacterium]